MKKIFILGSALVLGSSLQAMTMKTKIDVAIELRSAAQGGDLHQIRQLLQEKELDLLEVDAKGNTALHYAAAAGQIQALSLLLDYAAEHKVGAQVGATESSAQRGWECAETPTLLLEALGRVSPYAIPALGYAAQSIDGMTDVLGHAIRFLYLSGPLYSGIILNVDDERPHFENPEDPRRVLAELNAYATEKKKVLEIGVMAASNELTMLKEASFTQLKPRIFNDVRDAVDALTDSHDTTYALLVERAVAGDLSKDTSLFCLGRKVGEALHRALFEPDAQKTAREKLAHSTPLMDLTNKHGVTALHYAVDQGHLECVRLLLTRGANFEVCAGEDTTQLKDAPENARCAGTPLHGACQLKHIPIAQLLLDADANPAALDTTKKTPLHSAAIGGSQVLVDLLLSKGAHPKQWDAQNKTAQHYAHEKGHYLLAAHFLTREGVVNTCNSDRMSALHFAAMANDCALASQLEKDGALLSLVDKQGYMAIHHAARLGNLDMLGWCLDRRPFFSKLVVPVLCAAARGNQTQAAEILIQRKIEIEPKPINLTAKDSVTKTEFEVELREISYMLWALEERLPGFVDLLLKHGIEETPEITLTRDLWKCLSSKKDLLDDTKPYPVLDIDGAFPIHYAAANGHQELCETFLRSVIAFELVSDGKRNFGEMQNAYFKEMQSAIGKENKEIDALNKDRKKHGFVEKPHKEVPPFVWADFIQMLDPAKLDGDKIWAILSSCCWLELEKQPDAITTDSIALVAQAFEKVSDFFDEIQVRDTAVSWKLVLLAAVKEKVISSFMHCLYAQAGPGIYQGLTASECALLTEAEQTKLKEKEEADAKKADEDARKERDEASLARGNGNWNKAMEHQTKAYSFDEVERDHKAKAKVFRKAAKRYKALSEFLQGYRKDARGNYLEDAKKAHAAAKEIPMQRARGNDVRVDQLEEEAKKLLRPFLDSILKRWFEIVSDDIL